MRVNLSFTLIGLRETAMTSRNRRNRVYPPFQPFPLYIGIGIMLITVGVQWIFFSPPYLPNQSFFTWLDNSEFTILLYIFIATLALLIIRNSHYDWILDGGRPMYAVGWCGLGMFGFKVLYTLSTNMDLLAPQAVWNNMVFSAFITFALFVWGFKQANPKFRFCRRSCQTDRLQKRGSNSLALLFNLSFLF